ncbi:peptide chain release factor 2 [Candidatus Parcubacteria bacterium]|nr:peptide chain release factor 2 [Candidatus Parcubacteria bacterium]
MDAQQINELAGNIQKDVEAIDLEKIKKKQIELKKKSEEPGFWNDNQKAIKVMQQLARLEEKINAWEQLQKESAELKELLEMHDESLRLGIEKQFKILRKKYTSMHTDLAFSGPYDEHNVLLDIRAGAGGVDAQDWAAMLQRMYLRWAEAQGYKARILDESIGDEAGLKSVSLEISGPLAYGKLKGEHGVHRLVRQSPFNAQSLRQTSFAKVDIMPEIDEPESLPIDDSELKIDVFRAGGRGGQSVNTTDSAVRVTHLPTGIVVSIQNERSQLQNKETAMTILRSKLAQLKIEQHAEKISQLKGPNEQAAWGNQIRNYVLHPYKQVKDLRTGYESKDPDKVLDGDLNDFLEAYTDYSIK